MTQTNGIESKKMIMNYSSMIRNMNTNEINMNINGGEYGFECN